MAEWRNRIIEYGQEEPEDLLANPRNWRIHPKTQQDALSGVLDEIGWIDDVIVNKRTGFVVDGHLRVSLAISKGDGKVPVKYVDLSEEEEMIVLATIDPIAAMAATDKDKLSEVFDVIQSDNEQVQQLLDDIAKKERLEFEVDEDPGAQIDKADELQEKWQVERGQVWQIGDHRLMCGDATNTEDIDVLIGGESYSVLTDPPYNIGFNYEGIDDEMAEDEYIEFCKSWFNNIITGAIGLIMSPGPHNESRYPKPRDRGFWVKRYATAGASCFHLRLVEPLLFYGKFAGKRNTDVFEYSSGFPNELTAAQRAAGVENKYPPAKSAPLWKELTGMHVDGTVVVDVFLGNGTTMVAAQQLNRVCYGMEIEPKYCAVTLERMSEMGLEPALTN